MKYLIITEDGNGYHCSCCRRTSKHHETMEFDSDQELKNYIESYNNVYKDDKWNIDSRITTAYKLSDDNPIYGND